MFASTQTDTATELNQIKIYKKKKVAANADFNYSKLSDIDGNIKHSINIKSLMKFLSQYKAIIFTTNLSPLLSYIQSN